MVTFAQAAAMVRALPPIAGTEWVPLAAAAGRIAGQTVAAPCALPRVSRSAMDGYAVRSSDLLRLGPDPVLRLAGRLAAGDPPGTPLRFGQCRAVATGATVPSGADTVVPQEWTRPCGEQVQLLRLPSPGENVVTPGEEGRAGGVLLRAGAGIGARNLAALAAYGQDRVLVRRSLRVALATTGDELVAPGQPLGENRVFESSSWALQAEMRAMGLEVGVCGHGPDRMADLTRLFGQVLAAGTFDAVLTTGGVSVGERDLVAEAWESLGARRLFSGVAVKPGKAVYVAQAGNTWVFSLSGNPHAALATFYTLVRPGLDALGGGPPRGCLRGRLERECAGRPGRTSLRWAEPGAIPGTWRVLTGLSVLETLVRAHGLVLVPPGAHCWPAGGEVDVLPLEAAAAGGSWADPVQGTLSAAIAADNAPIPR